MTNKTVSSGEEFHIQQIASGFQVVHATSGRLRLRTNDMSLKPAVKTFAQILRQQEGVSEVQINETTGSLVVAFDNNKLSQTQIIALMQQLGVSQTLTTEEKTTDYFAAWKSVEFWKEQGLDLIPLATGLAVTGRLGISGLAAIGVYMLTAEATRQAISLTKDAWLEVKDEWSEEKRANGANGAEVAEGAQGRVSKQLPITNYQSKIQDALEPYQRCDPKSQISTPYKIVHAVPGRVRFIVPRLAEDRVYTERVQKLLKANAAIASFRLSRDAGSIAIHYKPSEGITVSHWSDLLQQAEAQSEQQNNHAAVPTEQKLETQQSVEEDANGITLLPQIDRANAIESNSLWAVMKSPALNVSLAFMANFPLQTVPE